MSRGHGQLLLIAALLIIFLVNLNRPLFKQEEGPVFLSDKKSVAMVELGTGFPDATVHQFIDGTSLLDVINLTDMSVGESIWSETDLNAFVQNGQRVDLDVKNDRIEGLTVSWMSAAKRVALGVPLHPDRMSETDWQVLPGIGVKMARRIENNRQKSGDFGSFWNLERVSGVGKKRLTSWNQYFFTNSP